MEMEPVLKSVRVARAYMKSKIDDLSHEQLLLVPQGATNNVLWNIGHIVLSHYRLAYRPSGGTVPVPQTWEGWFLPGDRKSTRLNSSHIQKSRMPSSA